MDKMELMGAVRGLELEVRSLRKLVEEAPDPPTGPLNVETLVTDWKTRPHEAEMRVLVPAINKALAELEELIVRERLNHEAGWHKNP